MSNFKNSILFVLQNEGGFADVKNDKGGATNYGISTRFLKLIGEDVNKDGHISEKDAKALTLERAVELYEKYFWLNYRLDSIRNVIIASKVLDLFVNMRGKSAGRIIQKALNDNKAKLSVDGIVGSKTFAAINQHGAFTDSREILLKSIRKHQAEFYRAIVKNDKTQNKFLKGWLTRASR